MTLATTPSNGIRRNCKAHWIACVNLPRPVSARWGHQSFRITSGPSRVWICNLTSDFGLESLLLQRRYQLLVPVLPSIPDQNRRGIFALTFFFHIDTEDRLLFQRQTLYGESFEGQVDKKKLGVRL